MKQDNFERRILDALAKTDMGIYPAAVSGCNDEKDYKERDGFKNGWNAAVCEYGTAIRSCLYDELDELTNNEKLFMAGGEYNFSREEDGSWSIFLNDTWYWGCSDCEEIPKEEENEIARLFKEYGRAGLMYWIYLKRGHASEFPMEQFMIVSVKEMEELRKTMSEQKTYYFSGIKSAPENLANRMSVVDLELKRKQNGKEN